MEIANDIKVTPFPKEELSTETEGMNDGPMEIVMPPRRDRRRRGHRVRVEDDTKGTRETIEQRKQKNRKRDKVAKKARKRNR